VNKTKIKPQMYSKGSLLIIPTKNFIGTFLCLVSTTEAGSVTTDIGERLGGELF
jgi:hypothetical protein